MKHKKFMSILLAGTVLLAGCGKKDDTEEPASGNTTETEISESVSEVDESDVEATGDTVVVTDATAGESVETSETTIVYEMNYAAESWYSTNVPMEAIFYENCVDATVRNAAMYCFYPSTDIAINVNPASDDTTLTFDVIALSFDQIDSLGGTALSDLGEEYYVISGQEVTANENGVFRLEWTDGHSEEWLGLIIIKAHNDMTGTSISAQAALGVPSLIAEA